MSKQPAISFPRERLHGAVMQAHGRVQALDRRLRDERRRSGIEPLLELWLEAAAAVRVGLRQKRSALLADGNPATHLDRIDERLAALVAQGDEFVLAADLETGAASWQHLAYEVASLSGPGRDALLSLVVANKDEVDDALEGLARVRAGRSVDPEQRRRIGELQEERQRESRRYEQLREEYLETEEPARRVPPPAALAFVGDRSRFESPLAHLFRESRFERLALPDLRSLGDDRRLDRLVTGRFDKTLASLAMTDRRTLTDPRVAQLRRHIARLDGVVARFEGAPATQQVLAGQELGVLLRRMANLASEPVAARHLASLRPLVEERRAAVARIAGAALAPSLAEIPRARTAVHGALPAGQHPPTPLARIHHVLQPLRPEAARARRGDAPTHAFVQAERRKHPRPDEEAPERPESGEPLRAAPQEDERVHKPPVVGALVPRPPPKKEPKRELVAPRPPLPAPSPHPEEVPALPPSPDVAPRPPLHALAKIAHLRAIASRLGRRLRRKDAGAARLVPAIRPRKERTGHELSALEKALRSPRRALPRVAEKSEQQPSPPPPPAPPRLPAPRLPIFPLEMLLRPRPMGLAHRGEEQEIERGAVPEGLPVPEDSPGDLLSDFARDSDDDRVLVDSAAHRGDVHEHQGDDADPDAVDTWVGGGEGVKLFSDVFGPFLGAEASPQAHAPEEETKKQVESSGFFADLFRKAEDFAEHAAQRVAHGAARAAAQAAHADETGRSGLPAVGHAIAGRAQNALQAHRFAPVDALRTRVFGGGTRSRRAAPEHDETNEVLDEGRPLDALTQERMRSFLQNDFENVRVHTGKGAEEIAASYGAEAVTVTSHIFFAPGKFNPATREGERLIAHELSHVMQQGRQNLDVRTAESEALRAEHSYGKAPAMETLDLRRPAPDFKFADFTDGEGQGLAPGVHTAKRTRSRRDDAGGKDELPAADEFLEKVSGRVYELLMEELEESFESR